MNRSIRQFAIIGPTASGKSNLAIKIAKKINAHILSLDSLSLYKEIDIVSAKPTLSERDGIIHYGIDQLRPDEPFNVTIFEKLYRKAYLQAAEEGKNLIIVGGTSFYLKVLIDGISSLPALNESTMQKVKKSMADRDAAYQMLYELDPPYMQSIAPNDSYRVEKALEIYYASGELPSHYFRDNPPLPAISEHIPLYHILTERAPLRSRIAERTTRMLQSGLIDEVAYLEQKYTRSPNCMKAIGIKETLNYLDGVYDKQKMEEKIIINTARLAKRQVTFNKSQFESLISSDIENLEKRIMGDLQREQ
ncbi:MAG TPA: tRNA (adenosine(37)-N6)-dimethylallyltransferase MiaA [Epsilonproteobacteria bacterium]|nr:tRNA (adenosine(37)-N6)-dimethylallyltransferase MiaA [Campylobacterota bacterium]